MCWPTWRPDQGAPDGPSWWPDALCTRWGQARGHEWGADAFLEKPLDPLRFVSTVKDLLGRSAFLHECAGARPMSERLSSGHPRLDAVLGGGLPANAHQPVIGLPGTGKTILAQQYVFAQRDARTAGAVPVDRVRAAREDAPLRRRRSTSSTRPSGRRGLLRGSRLASSTSDGLAASPTDRRADQGAQARHHRHRQLQGALGVRRRERTSAGSCTSSPAASAPSRPPRSGSASTPRTPSPTRPSSPSRTRSSRSPPARIGDRETPHVQVLKLRGSSHPRARTPTGSPRTGSTSSRGSPTPSRSTTTCSAATGSPRASRRSTSCSRTATGPAPRRCAPARPDRGRRSWACISSSTAHATEIRE